MRIYKRTVSFLLSAILCLSLLSGCAEDRAAGLSLPVCIGSQHSTLDPIYAEDIESQTTLVHLYENLMRVSSDGSGGTMTVNGMAEDVEIEENTDGTVTYTFELRSAKWSDGRKVMASDFVYAWQRLANPASFSPYAELLSIVCGYAEARTSGDMSLLQVIAKNESTLEVTLSGNYNWFISEVCTSPATMPLRSDVLLALKEENSDETDDGGNKLSWWSDPTALVTNGPYVAESFEVGTVLRLVANPHYESSRTYPANIHFYFANSAEDAELLYNEGTVDAIWPLTETRLSELAADETWSPIPQLSTYTVIYNCTSSPLSDPAIRKAMTLAIDRNALMEPAGITALVAEGLVPPGVPESKDGDFRTTGGPLVNNAADEYEVLCQEAAHCLQQAGYESGAALGELEYLYIDEGQNSEVAELLCQQWRKTLGLRITPTSVTEQELWRALRTDAYTLAGVDLQASGNDAECFLMEWTSDSQDNVANYENSAYDTLMSIIAGANDGTARMGCLHDAEALLLGDYALTPLYTKGTDWTLREHLTGSVRDARGWFCFTGVSERSA